MPQPQVKQGSRYQFLQYQVRGRVLQADLLPNMKYRDLIINLFYGPQTGCDSTPNSPGQKNSLFSKTHAEIVADPDADFVTADVTNLGTVDLSGFQQTFMVPLLAALNKRWVNNGVFGRWFDDVTDPFQSVGALLSAGVTPAGGLGTGLTISTTAVAGALTAAGVTAGGTLYSPGDIVGPITGGTGGYLRVDTVSAGGVVTGLSVVPGNGGTGYTTAAGPLATTAAFSYSNPTGDGAIGTFDTSLPLDNNVTIRRYTALRGKNWRGNIRPAPIDEIHSDMDQLVDPIPAVWNAMKAAMYSPISDGASLLWPLLISATDSQLVRNPTRIAYAPLVLPGVDPVTGNVNAVIDLALGESKRRKERKTTTV